MIPNLLIARPLIRYSILGICLSLHIFFIHFVSFISLFLFCFSKLFHLSLIFLYHLCLTILLKYIMIPHKIFFSCHCSNGLSIISMIWSIFMVCVISNVPVVSIITVTSVVIVDNFPCIYHYFILKFLFLLSCSYMRINVFNNLGSLDSFVNFYCNDS